MSSPSWPPSYAFEPVHVGRGELHGLLSQADRLIVDAQVVGVSGPSRHILAHNAVVLLAKLALAAHGWRTIESHHYWSIDSLKHTVGLTDDEVDVLQAHRSKRHEASYSSAPTVSDTEVAEFVDRVVALRARVVAWLDTEHAELWSSPAE